VRSASGSDAICAADSAGRLGKHEELADKERQRANEQGCTCGPKYLRLRSEHGELVKPRGGSVNLCEYCAKLAAVENCEMLMLDALEGDAPTVLMILGTRTATLDMGEFRAARDHMVKAIRRRWPAFEYACQTEYTTGYGPKSGGLRRPHQNWFVKGVAAADADELHEVAVPVWCAGVDAEPFLQYVAPIDNVVGLTKYVTDHFMKASQRPPAGFKGQRFNTSAGYFGAITRAQARARAKESLALKREIHKHGLVLDDAHEIELAANLAHRRNLSTRWVLASETGVRLSDAAIAKTTLPQRLSKLAASLSEPAATTGPS